MFTFQQCLQVVNISPGVYRCALEVRLSLPMNITSIAMCWTDEYRLEPTLAGTQLGPYRQLRGREILVIRSPYG